MDISKSESKQFFGHIKTKERTVENTLGCTTEVSNKHDKHGGKPMRYIIDTEFNEAGNKVFVKRRGLKGYRYLIRSEDGNLKGMTKDWLLQHQDEILNLGVDKNGTLYPVEPKVQQAQRVQQIQKIKGHKLGLTTEYIETERGKVNTNWVYVVADNRDYLLGWLEQEEKGRTDELILEVEGIKAFNKTGRPLDYYCGCVVDGTVGFEGRTDKTLMISIRYFDLDNLKAEKRVKKGLDGEETYWVVKIPFKGRTASNNVMYVVSRLDNEPSCSEKNITAVYKSTIEQCKRLAAHCSEQGRNDLEGLMIEAKQVYDMYEEQYNHKIGVALTGEELDKVLKERLKNTGFTKFRVDQYLMLSELGVEAFEELKAIQDKSSKTAAKYRL